MSDPIGWQAPETAWIPNDGVANTDYNRIETNILGIRDWLKQGGTFDVILNAPGGNVTGTIQWEKHAQGIIILKIPEMLGSSAVGAGVALTLTPVVAWPVDIRVAASGWYHPIQVMYGAANPPPADFANRELAGALELPYDAGTAVNIKLFGMGEPNSFPRNCGIYKQFVTYFNT